MTPGDGRACAQIPNVKRVACFYRVSTDRQLEQNEIPLQRNSCREFIDKHQDWVLVREYTERAVSGFKVPLQERRELLRALEDALAGQFDILLVYMFDRLGRRRDETPHVVQTLASTGVEVWSVNEGRQTFENDLDSFINYIRYWQAEGESAKTSVRVTDDHRFMTQQGRLRGGRNPYGYKYEGSGKKNRDGKELVKMVIDEDKARVVRMIFDLCTESGWGGHRIARHLNQHQIPSEKGQAWAYGTIMYLLNNPVYMGHLTFGKRSRRDGSQHNQDMASWVLSPVIEELQIVSEEQWNKAHQQRTRRREAMLSKGTEIDSQSPAGDSGDGLVVSGRPRAGVPTHGRLLLTGLVHCGCCGGPLSTTYDYRWVHDRRSGEVTKKRRSKYRCSVKALGKACNGQSTYVSSRLDGIVMEQVFARVEQLRAVDLNALHDEFCATDLTPAIESVNALAAQGEEHYRLLAALTKELPKSLCGESAFTPEMLRQAIDGKNREIETASLALADAERKVGVLKAEAASIRELQRKAETWETDFSGATPYEQKAMLAALVSRVEVSRDGITVSFHPIWERLLEKRFSK